MTIAMVFPGQGSQSVGMQAALADAYGEVSETFAEASDRLGFDLWRVVQDGPAEELDQTIVTQPAMLAAGVATWRIWERRGGPQPSVLAGHSLGEYTALVCSGAMTFSDAVPLVRRRAELMQAAVPAGQGAMAAILGLDDEAVDSACRAAATTGVVEAVNFNAPGQVVISGERGAVERAVEIAKETGARRAMLLPVSVPSHSSLMRDAGRQLADALADVDMRSPSIPVIGTTDVAEYTSVDAIRDALERQLSSPVQWVQTTRSIIAREAQAIVECGPGKVLAGLCRRIDKSVPTAPLETPEAIDKALAEVS